MTRAKAILGVHRSTDAHWVGDGFPVHTIFSYRDNPQVLTPFLLLDHAGPADFPPTDQQRGVDWHPHRGFETVTIVYDGAVDHEDSAGNRGSIGPGDVQWMTAGAGVLHKEMHGRDYARRGGRFEMLQLWVNLRATDKMTRPAYQTLLDRDIPAVALPDHGGQVRVIAGTFQGAQGPARTFTAITLLDVRLRAGQRLALDLHEGYPASVFMLNGAVRVNEAKAAGERDLVVLDRQGNQLSLEAMADATLLVMSGEPIDEPVVGHGPFVMNTQAEIEQAIADMRAGRLGRSSGPVA